ncbi:helix-turn-helix domain-containing protein [Mycobacteroides abscessus]|nr:helix-turn-helix transcriptional regulator [Mycobacteroides abscessus]
MGTNSWSRVIGSAIETARKKAGVSAVQLSAACEPYGATIHRVAISKIEAGDRDVTLPELAAIAAVLDIPPMALLFPDVLVTTEVMPGLEMAGTDALGWFSGLGSCRPMYLSMDGSEPELIWVDQIRVPDESWSIRLVEIEQSIKEQIRQLRRVESVPENPSMSKNQKAIRNENIEHAQRVLQLLKDDWEDAVFGQLADKYGLGNVPDGAYDSDRIAHIEALFADRDDVDDDA